LNKTEAMAYYIFRSIMGLWLLAVGPAMALGTGKPVDDFRLRNVNGEMVALSNYPLAKGFIVIFTCNHCPFAKLYSKRMNDLAQRFAQQSVPLLAINSMDSLLYREESFAGMQEKAKADGFQFPYLQDGEQRVGKAFGAEHTPSAYVIWKVGDQWQIKYAGLIDDNGENPESATPYIAQAVEELLQGKTVSTAHTSSFGCAIFYRKAGLGR
jgi:peroxiredoxin